MTLRAAVVLVALAVLTGCAEPTPAGVVDPNQPATGPLVALPPCTDPPQPVEELPPVEGAVLPPGTVVLDVTEQPPLTHLSGYVDMTPVNVRLWFEDNDDLEIIIIEDEVHESEMLVSDGSHRTYVKAAAICRTGSTVLGIVAEETAAEGLPVPTGAATPPPAD